MKHPFDASAPYMGRSGLTNQDAALAGKRELERRGLWGVSGPPETAAQRRERRYGYARLAGLGATACLVGAVFSKNPYQTQVCVAGIVLFGIFSAYSVFLGRLEPLQEQTYRRRMRWGRAILFGLLGLAFAGGAGFDYLIRRPDSPAWFAVAGLFVALALDQGRRARARGLPPG